MNGMSINLTWTLTIRLVSTGHHDRQRHAVLVPGPGRHRDGPGLDDVRPARPGAVRPAVRPDRPAGSGLAAAGLGGRDPAGGGAAEALAVPAPDPGGRGRPRRGDRGADHAVHGGGGPAAARYRQRAGVPRPALRGGRPRLWPALAAAGVLVLTHPWQGGASVAGVAFALGAAACWAAYILLTQAVGDEAAGLQGLAVSIPVAALVTTVVVTLVTGPGIAPALTPHLLL